MKGHKNPNDHLTPRDWETGSFSTADLIDWNQQYRIYEQQLFAYTGTVSNSLGGTIRNSRVQQPTVQQGRHEHQQLDNADTTEDTDR